MKRLITLILLVSLMLGLLLFGLLRIDRKPPVISVKNRDQQFTCETTFENLLDNAFAEDDNELKDFFIEERNYSEIAEDKKVTYVAIDSQNNVSKETLYLNVNDEVLKRKIVLLQPLKIELKDDFLLSDYFAVQNECGWTFKANLDLEGADLNSIGTYKVTVSAPKDPSIVPLVAEMEVNRFSVPVITLRETEIEHFVDEEIDPAEEVVSIEDDKDSEEYLFDTLVIDPGNYDPGKEGDYRITYSSTDSNGNTGTATLTVRVRKRPESTSDPYADQIATCEYNGGTWDYYWNDCYYNNGE